MANKLTSLTGFGEGDPKPEKKNVTPAVGKKMHKVRFSEDGRRRILNWGEQSSSFKAAHKEEKRLYPERYAKSKALSKKVK